MKNRRILIESVLVCLVLLGLAACTPTPPENIYWEPDGSGFIRFRTDDPANAAQGFVKLYPLTQEDPMTTPVEVTVKKILGSVGGGFGVVFCALDEQNYFKVLITVGKMYKITRVIAGGDTLLKDWTRSTDLMADWGYENTLKITHGGGMFNLSFNAGTEPPITFPDSGVAKGQSGFYAYVSTAANEYENGWVDVRFKMFTPVVIP